MNEHRPLPELVGVTSRTSTGDSRDNNASQAAALPTCGHLSLSTRRQVPSRAGFPPHETVKTAAYAGGPRWADTTGLTVSTVAPIVVDNVNLGGEFTMLKVRARRLIVVLSTAAAVLVLSLAGASAASSESRGGWSTPRTHGWTQGYLAAIEREDMRYLARRQHPDAVLVHPISFSGRQEPDAVFTGSDQTQQYLRGLFDAMSRIEFVEPDISVTDGGRISFVAARGDFVTADGRAYRNVYLLRLKWTRDGRVIHADEYYNPITYCQTFPQYPAC